MTISEAIANIGKPFKYSLCVHWDVIKEVTEDGYIIGDIVECHCSDARLKEPVPEGLKKYKDEQRDK